MPVSERELGIHCQAILDAVGKFLPCTTREQVEPISDELETLYEKSFTQFGDRVGRPDFAGTVGLCAYALSIYYVQYRFVPDEAEKYSKSSMNLLKLYIDAYGDTMPDSIKKTVLAAHTTVCENAAYIAYYKEDYYGVISILNGLTATTFSLALAATAMALIADGENNSDKARTALKMFDLLDEQIKEPATKPHIEDVYRNAYTFYALMLVTNHERYAGAGFEKDVPKSLYVLRRGMNLIQDEEYISWLQKDYDRYITML